jgi:polysaccharide biosynthesis transport protein
MDDNETQLVKRFPDFESRHPQVGYDELEEQPKSDLNLRSYLLMVSKHKFLIIALTVLTTAAAAVYMARKPDLYGAAARVQIDLESNPAIDVNGKPLVINNPSNAPDYFETQLEILRGAGLLRRVVKTLDLEHNRAFNRPQSGQRTTWQRLKHMVGLGDESNNPVPATTDRDVLMTATVAPPTEREDLAEIKRLTPYVWSISGNLETQQIGRTRLVAINFTHRDPQIAAKVVNAIADTFVLTNLERMTETNAGTGAFLKKRIADLQSQIRNGEERLVNYAKANEIVSLNDDQNAIVERLINLNTQVMQAENDRKMAEATYRAAKAPGAIDSLTADGGLHTTAESRLIELRQRLAQLKSEYTDKWPEVRQVEEQIKDMENQSSQLRARSGDLLIKSLERKFLEAQQREQLLRSTFEGERTKTFNQSAAGINYRIIQQEIQTNQQLLNGLLQRYKENDVILAGTPNNIRVADYANTPESPIGPQRTRGIGLAFICALVFGIGLALCRELWDNSFRTAADVERKLRLPAIAVVPRIKPRGHRLLPAFAASLKWTNGNGKARPLLTAETATALAEVYRKLRTSVLLSRMNGESRQVLLVTSSLPAEGKTTTTVNVGKIFAQTGAKVLIIDADLRKPTLHNIFETNGSQGLSGLLQNDADESDILAAIIQEEDSGMYILPAGERPENPAELLSSAGMFRVIEVLKKSFTHIIIDAPPVISYTDSVLISTLVDGVLLVVEGGKSSPEVVQHSRRELLDAGAPILGVVLNSVEQTSRDNYYYGAYSKPA